MGCLWEVEDRGEGCSEGASSSAMAEMAIEMLAVFSSPVSDPRPDVKIVNRYRCCQMWYLLVLRTVRVCGAGSRSRIRRFRNLGPRAGEGVYNVRPGIIEHFTFADRSK